MKSISRKITRPQSWFK